MGAVRVGYAIAFPKDAPIDFEAIKAYVERYSDEDDLSEVTDDEGKQVFIEYYDSGSSLMWGIEDAEQMIGSGDLLIEERDGWVIHGAQADSYGDGGSDETIALQALMAVAGDRELPKAGSGGFRAVAWPRGPIPPLDASDWWG